MNWIDPDCLPAVGGVVARYLPTIGGGVDGLLLQDGTEVYLGTGLGGAMAAAVGPGTMIQVHGLKPVGASMLVAVAILPPGGTLLRDDAAPEAQDQAERLAAQKVARKQARAGGQAETRTSSPLRGLHGSRGELRGVLLDDGTVARVPASGAAALGRLLAQGGPISLSGELIATSHGGVMLAGRIGSTPDTLEALGRGGGQGRRAAADPAARGAGTADRRQAKQQEIKATRAATREATRTAKREVLKTERMAAKKAERQAGRKPKGGTPAEG